MMNVNDRRGRGGKKLEALVTSQVGEMRNSCWGINGETEQGGLLPLQKLFYVEYSCSWRGGVRRLAQSKYNNNRSDGL